MKRSGLFWGILILLLGIFLLLQNLGLIPDQINAWGVFWAIVIIAVGVRWLVGGMSSSTGETQQVHIPQGDLSHAIVDLHHGAGKMQMRAANSSNSDLLYGTFEGGVDYRMENGTLSLSAPSAHYFWPFEQTGANWDIELSRDIPLELSIESGASDNVIDLSELKVTKLRVQVGASSTRVTVPAMGDCRAEFKSGAASFQVKIPQGVAARIHLQTGLSGISVDTSRFPGSGRSFESSDYANAINRVDLLIESGVGSIEII